MSPAAAVHRNVVALVAVAAIGAAPAAGKPAAPDGRGHCIEEGWCWENPLPNGNAPLALWGSATNDVWAAGDGGTILHFDGVSWKRSTAVQSDAKLNAIWGRDTNDVWVAGDGGTVLHWDGNSWAERSVHAGPLVAIGAGDSGEVWVADIAGSVWSWTGVSWKESVTARCNFGPKKPGVIQLGCVWDTLTSSAGGTMIHPPPWDGHWDGTRLVRGKIPPPPRGRAFGGSRSTDVWLRKWGIDSEVSRWDGKRWVPLGSGVGASWQPSDIYPSTTINAIWGASDDDVWAVGVQGQILRFDGKRWRAFDGGTRANLEHVWGSGPNDVWASGAAGLLHWDGARWKLITTSAGDAQLEDVWGLDACHAWAVGAAGTILRRDCAGWAPVASGVNLNLYGVGGSGPDDVWVVGDAGTILHAAGQGAATKVPAPTKSMLFSVWAASARDAWAVGTQGTILRWDGEAWRAFPGGVPSKGTLCSVHGASAKRIVAADMDGGVFAFDGDRWSAMPRPPHCANDRWGDRGTIPHPWVEPNGPIWVSCPSGRVYRYEQGSWIEVIRRPETLSTLDTYYYDYDVAAAQGRAWIAGGMGSLIDYTADRRIDRSSGTSLHLRALWTTASGLTWAVGDRGAILSFKKP